MAFAAVAWAYKELVTSAKLGQMVENTRTHDHRMDGTQGAPVGSRARYALTTSQAVATATFLNPTLTETLDEGVGGFSYTAGGGLIVPADGWYAVHVLAGLAAVVPTGVRAFVDLDAGGLRGRSGFGVGEDNASASYIGPLLAATGIKPAVFYNGASPPNLSTFVLHVVRVGV